MRGVLLALLATTCSCSQLVRYTDELGDARSGRSLAVTTTANTGAFLGFIAGLPFDLAALPVTFVIYRIQREQNKLQADPISTMLFPSFVLWRAGTLLAAPFDMIEFVTWRAWQPPVAPNRQEQLAIEYEIDEETLGSYPVTPIYPLAEQ